MNIYNNKREKVDNVRIINCSPNKNREFYEAIENLTNTYKKYDTQIDRNGNIMTIVCRNAAHANDKFIIEITGIELCALIKCMNPTTDNDINDNREGHISQQKLKKQLYNTVGSQLYNWYEESISKRKI